MRGGTGHPDEARDPSRDSPPDTRAHQILRKQLLRTKLDYSWLRDRGARINIRVAPARREPMIASGGSVMHHGDGVDGVRWRRLPAMMRSSGNIAVLRRSFAPAKKTPPSLLWAERRKWGHTWGS
jgi:hypothetical protein